MQSGRRVERDSSNSAPDGNVSTSRPTERIRRLNALRIGSSSSTTAIKDRVLVTMAHCKWCETRKILDLGLLDFGPIAEKGRVRWKASKETRERWNAKDKEPSAVAPSHSKCSWSWNLIRPGATALGSFTWSRSFLAARLGRQVRPRMVNAGVRRPDSPRHCVRAHYWPHQNVGSSQRFESALHRVGGFSIPDSDFAFLGAGRN